MERTHVHSSDLKSVGYAEAYQILEIEFRNDRIYQYQNVPRDVFGQLLAAESKGKFFHYLIKDNYPYVRIS
ncbi:KTSC domain-containing protein [Pectinatus frisingensis]|uniref:KTSC domain-containing protein n=1 Tax=Pectinatus frisingensis TaxID=865 RepID=UPI003D8006F1